MENWIQLRNRRDNPELRPKEFQLHLTRDSINEWTSPSRVKFVWRRGQWRLRTPWMHIWCEEELQSLLEICRMLNKETKLSMVK